MSNTSIDTVTINGVTYYAAADKPSSARAVVVVDRGWIFAGDMTRKDGRIYLSRAVWVFRWESVGFDGVIADPKQKAVTIKKIADVEIPEGSEIFCVPVVDTWGL